MDLDLDALKEIFSRFDLIDAVYLFGSKAEGRAWSESDYDFALVSSCRDEARLRRLREDVLGTLTGAGFDHLSVINIDFSDLYLTFQAVKNNVVVYKKESFASADFYSQAVRRYLDFEPHLIRQRKAFKERNLCG